MRYGDYVSFGAPGYDTGRDCPVPEGRGFLGSQRYEDVDAWCDCMYQDQQLNANCKKQFPRDGAQYVPLPWTALGKAVRNLPGDIIKQILESAPPPAGQGGPSGIVDPKTKGTNPTTASGGGGMTWDPDAIQRDSISTGRWPARANLNVTPKSNTGLIAGAAAAVAVLFVLMKK